MALQHIFFDLDRTLWDFDRNSRETLYELFHLHIPGLQAGPEAFIKTYEEINETMWAQYRNGIMPREVLRYKRFEDTLLALGIPNPDKTLVQILSEQYLLICPQKPFCLPGVHATLSQLSRDYCLHIITNGFYQTQHTKLAASDLRPFFKAIVTSEDANAKKPDAAIFEFALSAADALPENSLMIGDDIQADVAGALSAGMTAVHFAPDNHQEPDGYYRIQQIDHLLAVVQSLNK